MALHHHVIQVAFPRWESFFSSDNVPTARAVALLQGNASTQCENIQASTKTSSISLRWRHLDEIHLPHLERSHQQRKMTLGTMQGLSRIIFRTNSTVRVNHMSECSKRSPATLFSPTEPLFSGPQWLISLVNTGRYGIWTLSIRGLLLDPRHTTVVEAKVPLFDAPVFSLISSYSLSLYNKEVFWSF